MWYCLGLWEDWVLLTYSSGGGGGDCSWWFIPFGLTPWEDSCSISPGIMVESCTNVLLAAGQKIFDPAGSLVLGTNFV